MKTNRNRSALTLQREMVAVLSIWLLVTSTMFAESLADATTVITVVGAAGEPEYGKQFANWVERWQVAAEQAGATYHHVGTDSASSASDKEHLQNMLALQHRNSPAPLWIVLIGHGTFDGNHAKFNLRGPDVSAVELNEWFEPFHRTLVVVNCSSSSGPFINAISSDHRIIITATKSGYEMNFARFGDFFSNAITDISADLDKDEQVSLLEAFLMASAQVREFYRQEARLATEQALIDDNGDGRGTPASWYRGIHPVRQSQDNRALDGARAHRLFLVPGSVERRLSATARQRRDELEQQIAQLRNDKSNLDEDEYYARLEPLLVELSRLYAEPGD